MKKTEKTERNPVVVLIAAVILLVGLGVVFIGVTNFAALGWLYATLIIASGLSSAGMAVMTIVTGKSEWLLIDLLLPG